MGNKSKKLKPKQDSKKPIQQQNLGKVAGGAPTATAPTTTPQKNK